MKIIRNFFISLLAFIYLLLEYLFWDTILKPIYLQFKKLQLYKAILEWIQAQNKYLILTIFVLFFGISEIMGIWALALLSQGFVGLFIVIYIIKFIPVAVAFTILKNSKERLLTINWFAVVYHFTMKMLYIIRTNSLFLRSKEFLEHIKTRIQSITKLFNRKKRTRITFLRRLLLYIIKKNRFLIKRK
jgi:hypothetical protein